MKKHQAILVQLLTLTMLSFLTSFKTVGQDASLFFMPAKPNNMSYFRTPTKSGAESFITTVQYNHLDTLLELTTSGDLGSPYSRKEYFVIYGNEINIYQERYKGQNIYGRYVDEVKTYDSPPAISHLKTIGQTYFKMPTKGQTTSWYYIDLNKSLIRCTSNYTTLTIEGVKTRCVSVVKKPMETSGKETEWAQRVEYYAKGLGLYKVELLKTKEIFLILDHQGVKSQD